MKTHRNQISRSIYFPLVALLLSSTVILSRGAIGAELVVPTDFPSIQSAIDTSVSGDVILVEPGVYVENVEFGGKSLSLLATGGREITTIEAPGGKAVVLGPSASISGFTIRNAISTFGAGIVVRGSGNRITDSIFESNRQAGGGFDDAIFGNRASAEISGNIFRHISCDNQFSSGVIVFFNASQPHLNNNIFYDNPCRAINLTLPASGQALVVNNTMVRNRVGIRVDRRIDSSKDIYRNNIIVFNDIGLEVDFGTEANNPTWENNLVFGNLINYEIIFDQTGSFGNISADPTFVNAEANDFRLLGGSPAIDAGTSISAPLVDFEGDPRPIDGNNDATADFDIGADEFAFGITIDIVGGAEQECASIGGNEIGFSAIPFPRDLEINSVSWFIDGVAVASGVFANEFIALGEHLVELEATSISGESLNASSPVTVIDTLKPSINASFVDARTGRELTTIGTGRFNQIRINIKSADICDPSPAVRSVLGIPTEHGDVLRIFNRRQSVTLEAAEIELMVTAEDGSGNSSATSAVLTVDP